jgi:hypothetical protein
MMTRIFNEFKEELKENMQKQPNENQENIGKQLEKSQVLVAHACNPSYSGNRDQEDHSLKSAWAIVRETLS